MSRRLGTFRDEGDAGQALVEFALAIIVFLVLVMAVIDFGRGICTYNGVSQAAREIARAASVHPYAVGSSSLGSSDEVNGVVATQKKLVPGLATPTFTCVDIDGSTISGTCNSGYEVKVTVTAPYQALTPLLGALPTYTMQSSSTIKVQ